MRARRLLFATLAVVACTKAENGQATPPAEFLISAGDSTFWVRPTPEGLRARGAPLTLVYADGHFREVYVTDIDRSHRNAVFVGQVLYWRDLTTNDSTALLADTSALILEREYARATPWDPRIKPDEEAAPDPAIEATTDIAVLDVHGPYLSFEARDDVEAGDTTRHRHAVRRGVIDLRTSRVATLTEVAGARAGAIVEDAEASWRKARDSVKAAQSEAGRAAERAMGDFPFDENSWSLTMVGDSLAVGFVVPGKGIASGGLTLALPPIALGRVPWFTSVERAVVPRDVDGGQQWRAKGYDVIVRPDAGGERAEVIVRGPKEREWPAARIPLPVRRVMWLDAPPIDRATRVVLSRAFDDAGLYGDDVRTASTPLRTPTATPVRFVTRRTNRAQPRQ